MAVKQAISFRHGSLMRSKSEGTLIDLGPNLTSGDSLNGVNVFRSSQNHHWQLLQPEVLQTSSIKNPFWSKLSSSNPFLADVVDSCKNNNNSDASDLKEEKTQLEPSHDDDISTSSDEGNLGNFLPRKLKVGNQSGRWRSASDILDDLGRKAPKSYNSSKPPGPVLSPDFEWLKNDIEAYKMAWLSHRQLTRSCLDLNLMSKSPGWAQTQAANFQVISKIDHHGGRVELPESKISIHVPEGHVPPGEIQEISLKAMLEPPPGLNTSYMTTLSPLLEVLLSNINTKESLSVDMKLSGQVKSDPDSQLMTTVSGLVSSKREGPYVQTNDCNIQNNTIQIKLQDLKTHFFVIAVAEASPVKPPVTSVWDYLDRQITIAVYGPRYIHPSFKLVIVVCCHEDVPPKLPFSDICRGNKQLPPVVLQLWRKHSFKFDKLVDFEITVGIKGSVFQIKAKDQVKQVRQSQLKIGTVVHLPVNVSCSGNTDLAPFELDVDVKELNLASGDASFQVPSPPAAPIRSEKRISKQLERRTEIAKTSPIPEESDTDDPEFEDRPMILQYYGVALKTVIRQPHVDYLLEYFKGDTLALLSTEAVRSVGNLKVKEWYIGFLRGRTGLVHCKNVKVITRDQVIDFTGIKLSTEILLHNMARPLKKLTYMYSAIQTLVTKDIKSWRSFADALGYKRQPLDAITWRHAETEADKIACVLEKLKEDCHCENSKSKFLHELMMGLLKMDCVNVAAQLIQNTVILSAAVELGSRWRELAEKMAKLSSAQIASYEAPHRGKNGEVNPQAMWKPAYDFLYTWSLRYGNGYKDMIQDLHLLLDKMKNPVTRQWRQLTGALITVNCLKIFQDAAFPKH
ncbi:metastasis-associated in colon cancer protein 1 [Oryzias melastigma]|uniref:MET transcriptional regulator MACC1 n=1 Tax=Oryzias melastigma TaxID=30732 RepID=A0A3B3CL51_ORYME|nr:metastasis-associated in colon cancer protein 1 [Oryzias melastigma]XP_024124152.1 metastasis-associated in colon cancer protein 1 [Oryzias melastigma]